MFYRRRDYGSDDLGHAGHHQGSGRLTPVIVALALVLLILVVALLAPAAISGYLQNWHAIGVSWGLLLVYGPWALFALALLYGLIQVYYAFLWHPIHARKGRYPAGVNPRGLVTEIDNQEPRYDEVRSIHSDFHNKQEALPAPESVVDEAAPALVPPPLARALILQGAVGQSEDILLGFDATGQPLRRTWKQLKAILILGLQGGGKTTTACWLLLQVVLAGGRIALIDKHAHSEEDSMTAKLAPLAGCFICPVGGDPASALQVIATVRHVFETRLAGAPCDEALILAVDEFTAIARQAGTNEPWAPVADALLPLLEDLNSEGRKHKVYALCIGQVANASRTGGSEVRDTFNTRIVHALREKQATLLALTEQKQEIARLERGQVFFDIEGPDDPFFGQIPLLLDADLSFVATQLRLPAPQVRWAAPAPAPAPTPALGLQPDPPDPAQFAGVPPLPPLPWKQKPAVAQTQAIPISALPIRPVLTKEEERRQRILDYWRANPSASAKEIKIALHMDNGLAVKGGYIDQVIQAEIDRLAAQQSA